jgi:hypothetical protein
VERARRIAPREPASAKVENGSRRRPFPHPRAADARPSRSRARDPEPRPHADAVPFELGHCGEHLQGQERQRIATGPYVDALRGHEEANALLLQLLDVREDVEW